MVELSRVACCKFDVFFSFSGDFRKVYSRGNQSLASMQKIVQLQQVECRIENYNKNVAKKLQYK